jgi:phosphate transport system permease protein
MNKARSAPGSDVPATILSRQNRARHRIDLAARGEPFRWALGGALLLGMTMIVGFLVMVLWNGALTFVPRPVAVVTLKDGSLVSGAPTRSELFRPSAAILGSLGEDDRSGIEADGGYASRTLYRIGNYDIYNEDFRWIPEYTIERVEFPVDMVFAERLEWGVLVGRIHSLQLGERVIENVSARDEILRREHSAARDRWHRMREIEKSDIGRLNYQLEKERLRLRKVGLHHDRDSAEYRAAEARLESLSAQLQAEYDRHSTEVQAIRARDEQYRVTFTEIGGEQIDIPLSSIVRFFPANDLSFAEKLGIYFSRWWEYISDEPREANTEGGVFPAIFGTFAMTLIMVVFVAPFGVITALYLREYARQGRIVSIVRISVNNLAGVPSIVYGVFGLGFFAYVVGGSIDQLFYAERLPNPTFGTGGLLWASLTLALLTVPVVIVATEEALSAVPRSMREGSLACGASKWQTIRNIVLPRAMPGIMTGIILAMARGAGEVAPLMLVGVVKLAPELPFDGFFPYVHLERSFMHLGFHIFDVGFQSRNSEAGKPMVFVTTLLLVALIAIMNMSAIMIRNRLKRKFAGSQF